MGRQLVEAAERWATERGVQEMKAKTWEFPEGPLPFYETLGYRTLSRELVNRSGRPRHDRGHTPMKGIQVLINPLG